MINLPPKDVAEMIEKEVIYWHARNVCRREKVMPRKKYCVGCSVHHDPALNLERMLGKCTCPCHASGKNWNLPKVKLQESTSNDSNLRACANVRSNP